MTTGGIDSDEMTYYCSNSDGDFTNIANTAFVHSIRGVASLYLAFRDAFDGICPTTTVSCADIFPTTSLQ